MILGYPTAEVYAEESHLSPESMYVPIDLTSSEIKDGMFVSSSQTIPVGNEGAFQVSLVKGKEYLFISTNVAAFELRDPCGDAVKAFKAVPSRSNKTVLFEYKASETGTYTLWSARYFTENTFDMRLYELFDPESLADMGQIYVQGNRLFYVKSDVNTPYTITPEVNKGSFNYVYLTPKDIIVNDVATGDYRRTNNSSMNILRSLQNGVNGPYLLYAPREVRYQEFELNPMSGVYIDFQAQAFNPKTGDSNKDYVTELNAEDRADSMVADPVDAFAGNFVDRRTLMSYSGSNPLSFEMNYDSIANNSAALRTGFSHNFETSVKETNSGLDVYWSPSSVVRFDLVDGVYEAVQDKQSGVSVQKTNDGFIVTDDSKQEYVFDQSGKLLTFMDKVGNEIRYSYTNNKLTAVENSKGQSFTFAYAYDGNLSTVTDLMGRKIIFRYSLNRLVGVMMPNGIELKITYTVVSTSNVVYKVSQLAYDGVVLVGNTYDNRGRVSEQVDGNKNKTTFVYDEYSNNDRVTTTVTSGSRSDVLIHDSLGNLLEKRDAEGYLESHQYDDKRNRVSTVDKNGNESIYAYDAHNRLVSVTNPDETTMSYEYDNRNNITKVVMQDGETVTNTYDVGRLLSTTDRAGNVVSYQYDANGNVTKIKREGYELAYGYDDSGYLIRLSINDDVTTHFENDALGRVIKTILPDGSFIQSTYDINNNVLKTIDQKGQERTMTYNTFGNLLTETDVKGTVTSYDYDANGNRVRSKTGDRESVLKYNAFNELVETAQVVDEQLLNNQTFTYNNRGELTATKDADGKESSFTYDGNGHTLSESVGDSVISYGYDSTGNNIAITDSYGNKTTVAYDVLGNRISETSPSGNVLVHTYDKMNRLVASTDALGNVTAYEYDIRGNLIRLTDAKGAVTTYEYNDNTQLTVSVNALGERQENSYNALGQLTEVTNNRDEVVLSYDYDVLGQVTKLTDGNGHTNEFMYDANGNQVSAIDALGHVIETTSYNLYDEVVGVKDVLGQIEQFEYDVLGNVTTVTDAKGNVSTNQYTKANRLSGVTDALNTRMDYTYDVYGQIASTGEGSDPNQKFTRDLNQNLIEERFGANSIKYNYSAEQDLVKQTNARGQDIEYEYDVNGRVVKETSLEDIVSYEYDVVGNVLVVASDDSRIERTYDALGRVLTKTQDEETIKYEYDDRGHLVKMTYPNGKAVDYTYDVMGNMLTVTDWNGRVTSYAYDANDRLIRTVNANGTEELLTYDAKGQVLTLVNKKGSTVLSEYSYSYDANGNIIKENDFVLKYDTLNRLTGAGDNTYAYSPLGNITSVDGGLKQSMTYGKDNELVSVNDIDTTVDADGNLTQYALDGVPYDAVYNSKNQMVSFDGVTYQYDAESNRIGLTDLDVKTTFVVDNDSSNLSRVLIETTGDESIYHIYGQGLIGSYVADGSFETNHYDYRGSVTGVSDETGLLVGSVDYDEYGVILEKDDSITTRFLYNGKYGVQTDSNGLYYMRARYYSSDLKRFMNRDVVVGSIEESQTLNRYAFVNGNPISYYDPFGLAREMLSNSILDIRNFMFATIKSSVQTVLNKVWFVPVLGTIGDMTNLLMAVNEGNVGNIVLSSAAFLPFVENVGTSGIAKQADDIAEVAVEGYTKGVKSDGLLKMDLQMFGKKEYSKGKYAVGPYNEIKAPRGSGLDAHHVGQKAIMNKIVDGYDFKTGPSINVPRLGHTRSHPDLGIVSRRTKDIYTPRQLLARDIRELRRVYTDIPNSVLKELIDLNKKMYPEMRK